MQTQWTPLMLAAMNGHVESSQVLIDSGASVNTVDEASKCLVHVAHWLPK